MDFVGWSLASHEVDPYAKVFTSLLKCCVSCLRDDPVEPRDQYANSECRRSRKVAAAVFKVNRTTGLGRTALQRRRIPYISGSLTPRSWYAFCLALRHAIKMDSVPPLVQTPAAPVGAWNIPKT